MRFAIVHKRLLKWGGLETRLYSYIDWLQKAGHEVSVIVYKVGKDSPIPDGIELIVPKIRWIPKHYRDVVFDRRLKKITAKRKFDFVLSLGRTSHQDAVLVPGNHLGYLRAQKKDSRSLKDRLQIKMDYAAYRAPGTMLACSQMMKDEIVELYNADAARIQVLHPPTDTRRFNKKLKERQQEFRREFGFAEGKKSFVFISTSHKRKGLPLLIEAFKDLKDCELFVAGNEIWNDAPPNIKFLGYIGETEKLYAAADGMISAANYEPFGQVVPESVLCGTPVIVSEMVGAKSVLSEKEGIIVNGFGIEEWRNAISSFDPNHFNITDEFATRNDLSLDSHMKRIVGLASKS